MDIFSHTSCLLLLTAMGGKGREAPALRIGYGLNMKYVVGTLWLPGEQNKVSALCHLSSCGGRQTIVINKHRHYDAKYP